MTDYNYKTILVDGKDLSKYLKDKLLVSKMYESTYFDAGSDITLGTREITGAVPRGIYKYRVVAYYDTFAAIEGMHTTIATNVAYLNIVRNDIDRDNVHFKLFYDGENTRFDIIQKRISHIGKILATGSIVGNTGTINFSSDDDSLVGSVVVVDASSAEGDFDIFKNNVYVDFGLSESVFVEGDDNTVVVDASLFPLIAAKEIRLYRYKDDGVGNFIVQGYYNVSDVYGVFTDYNDPFNYDYSISKNNIITDKVFIDGQVINPTTTPPTTTAKSYLAYKYKQDANFMYIDCLSVANYPAWNEATSYANAMAYNDFLSMLSTEIPLE